MNLINDFPNFSIVAPTGCNARCDFCFWNEEHTEVDPREYISNLWKVLDNLPGDFTQCSITGGEPTMLPWLHPVMKLVRERFAKVVFTTNGYNLVDHLYLAEEGLIDHLNISRHAIGYEANCERFNTDEVLEDGMVQTYASLFQFYGIDTSLNCVLPTDFNDLQFINKFVQYAKKLNCNSVAFRKDMSDLTDMGVEQRLGNIISTSGCPACKEDVRLINGMTTFCKYSVAEPSKDLGGIYELVYHPNSVLTSDWAGQDVINTGILLSDGGCHAEER